MNGAATVRLKTLDSGWETLGMDRLRGITAEGIEASSNLWGPDRMSFNLKLSKKAERLDLFPFTPVELEIDGVIAWAGFVWERPEDSNGYSVGCRGWQYHLDDNLYNRTYLHARVAGFRDVRSVLMTDLGVMRTGYTVSTDRGVVTVSAPDGSNITTGTGCAVILDLGPDCSTSQLSVDISSSFNTSSMTLYVMGSDVPWWNVASREDYVSGQSLGAAPFSAAGVPVTFTGSSSPHRYITVMLYSGVTSGVGPGDIWIKIHGIRAYHNNTFTTLKADVIAKDALTFAPLLNQSTGLVTAGTFNIPEYVTGGYSTPREVINQVNAYENYLTKIGGPDLRTLVYKPKPVAPIFEVGDWSGANFKDSSVSGEEIYGKVIVEATGPDGEALASVRGHGSSGQGFLYKQTVLTQSWSGAPGDGDGLNTTQSSFPEHVFPGLCYAVRILNITRIDSGGSVIVKVGFFTAPHTLVDGLTLGTFPIPYTGPSAFFPWVPTAERSALGVQGNFSGTDAADTIVITAQLFWGRTFPERVHMPRAKTIQIRTAITQAVADRFGDLWLDEHEKAPFAGDLEVTGADAVRRTLGGGTVPPHVLLLHTGEKIRLAGRVNPDTGGWGRDGRIAGVTYRHDARASAVAIDDRREDFERLLERYGALAGTAG